MRIGHAHLKVRDLEAATRFYKRFLGMTVREEIPGRLVFLSGGVPHHELALQRVAAEARNPGRFGRPLPRWAPAVHETLAA